MTWLERCPFCHAHPRQVYLFVGGMLGSMIAWALVLALIWAMGEPLR